MLYAFLDESGTHDLKTVDPSFPIFTLALVICSKTNYDSHIVPNFKELKRLFFGDDCKVLHSIDIRKSQRDFACLPHNSDVKQRFLNQLSACVEASPFYLVTVSIKTAEHKAKYTSATNPYDLALEFALERLLYCAESQGHTEILVIAESRGLKEDKLLGEQFINFITTGNKHISKKRLSGFDIKIEFRRKSQNIIGLQLADLSAYPIARYVLDPSKANPAFVVLLPKIYKKNGRLTGLKVFP